jgi:hypothetical protein
MQQDFWLPVRDGATNSSIDTLPGAQNLDQIGDIKYFQRNFYQSLKVPIGRLDSQNSFNVGRVTEITRDEVAFYNFILRLRQQFSTLFLEVLKRQLILKNIISPDEWETLKDQVYFLYSKNNYFGELKEQEMLLSRLKTVQAMEPYIGKYFSNKNVRDTILKQSDDLQKVIDEQISAEFEEYLEKTQTRADIDLQTADSQLIIGVPQQDMLDGNGTPDQKVKKLDPFTKGALINKHKKSLNPKIELSKSQKKKQPKEDKAKQATKKQTMKQNNQVQSVQNKAEKQEIKRELKISNNLTRENYERDETDIILEDWNSDD